MTSFFVRYLNVLKYFIFEVFYLILLRYFKMSLSYQLESRAAVDNLDKTVPGESIFLNRVI